MVEEDQDEGEVCYFFGFRMLPVSKFDDDKYYVTSEKVFITCPYQANLETIKLKHQSRYFLLYSLC